MSTTGDCQSADVLPRVQISAALELFVPEPGGRKTLAHGVSRGICSDKMEPQNGAKDSHLRALSPRPGASLFARLAPWLAPWATFFRSSGALCRSCAQLCSQFRAAPGKRIAECCSKASANPLALHARHAGTPVSRGFCAEVTIAVLGLMLAFAPVAEPASRRSAHAQQLSDPLVQKGFEHFYNVEYAEAAASFKQAVEAAPDDPNRYNHLSEAVLFGMMHRAGALESQMVTGGNSFLRQSKMEPTAEEQALFASSLQKVLEMTGKTLETDPNNVDALYAQGVAIGFRSTYNYLVKKSWIDSLRDATTARKRHNRVLELDPTRIDAHMMQGMHDYLIGSLPLVYKMLGFLAGFHGDKDEGIRQLKLVADQGVYNKVDAEILLTVIYRRERRPWEAIPLLESLHTRFPRNYLVLFELSQMYADMGDRAKALAPLDKIEKLKRSGAPGFRALSEARIQFARGNLLFWYKDFKGAIRELEQATASADQLDPNSGPSAWLRLGQCYDIKGRRPEALHSYQQAVAFTPSGEPAKEAQKYIDEAFSLDQMRSIQRATKLQKP